MFNNPKIFCMACFKRYETMYPLYREEIGRNQFYRCKCCDDVVAYTRNQEDFKKYYAFEEVDHPMEKKGEDEITVKKDINILKKRAKGSYDKRKF